MMSFVLTCKVDDMEGKNIELLFYLILYHIATTFITWHGKLQHILLTSRFCFMTFVAIVMYEKDSPFFVVYHKQRQ